MRVAVSGGRGFVGRSLLRLLSRQGIDALALVRAGARGPREMAVGDLAEDRVPSLPRAEALIHLAARVHVMNETEADPLAAYRRVNVHGTRMMLQAARNSGIRRFVFVSTIKVLGEETEPGISLTQNSACNPADHYAISKLEAEKLVEDFCEDHGIEWTIVRPVLVFGRGVSANFAQLVKLVDRQLPLPLASIRNERSFLFADNLSAFLAAAIDHPLLVGRAVNLSDPPALSTPQLIRCLARTMGRRANLFPFPPAWLEVAAGSVGKASAVRRLTRSLQVDTSELFREMRWKPPVSFDEALRETTADVLRHC